MLLLLKYLYYFLNSINILIGPTYVYTLGGFLFKQYLSFLWSTENICSKHKKINRHQISALNFNSKCKTRVFEVKLL